MPATATRTLLHVGDPVAWDMIDGRVMAGNVRFVGYSTVQVARVDGGIVDIATNNVRPSTSNDVLAAINFYTRKAVQS